MPLIICLSHPSCPWLRVGGSLFHSIIYTCSQLKCLCVLICTHQCVQRWARMSRLQNTFVKGKERHRESGRGRTGKKERKKVTSTTEFWCIWLVAGFQWVILVTFGGSFQWVVLILKLFESKVFFKFVVWFISRKLVIREIWRLGNMRWRNGNGQWEQMAYFSNMAQNRPKSIACSKRCPLTDWNHPPGSVCADA